MPQATKNQKLFCTVTVHNEEFSKSLSSLISVRNAESSQSVQEFIESETDFLTINSGFLNDIASNGTILIEVSITENLL